MGTGSGCGGRDSHWGLALFIKEDGGYATVAVAVALLVSTCMVFSLASVQWVYSRSADVQEVADACALAGQNAVTAFSTIAQAIDACVLSLGLLGLVVFGVSLVLAVIPHTQALAESVADLGKSIGQARREFARSAAKGLKRLEQRLPYLVVVNSASCLAANGLSGNGYVGCALPFPQQSQSDFSSLEVEASTTDLEDAASRLREASKRADTARGRAKELAEVAWRADSVDEPSCLRQRASWLAGLNDTLNPTYTSPDLWNFGVPLKRSRAYYAARATQEKPQSDDVNEVSNSAIRRVFYLYALKVLKEGHYQELPDGHVELSLPQLPCNTQEVKATSLYTDAIWPCTLEASGRVLHATSSCPGAKGPYAGNASLAAQDSGDTGVCEVCQMSVGDMGKVAAISTSATNGYEHYWKIVVEASQGFVEARNEEADAESEIRKISGEGIGAFEKALEELQVARPTLCPPGAWGCVSVVYRPSESTATTGLAGVFTREATIPEGAAISAAVLAPDNTASHNNVLSRVFDGLKGEGFSLGGALGNITELWGELLVGYGSTYGSVNAKATRVLDKADGVFGGTVGSWLKNKIATALGAAGLTPVDMRLRKPVLTGTHEVLTQAGYSGVEKARDLLMRLPDHGSAEEVAHALGMWGYDQIKDEKFTVAELPIPGTSWTIPLEIDLSKLEMFSS